ncbi:MAG: glycoside hydrolase family 127 protein [Tannerella sp.]|jgi:DUF1680 family protein|nr:glycoside hydrolase family 127 protein [Tannerella sp.]
MDKILLSVIATICLSACSSNKREQEIDFYNVKQVNLRQVELTDNFWLPTIRLVQEKTIRYAFDKCESEGRFANFKTAGDVWRQRDAANHDNNKVRGKMPFDDTDVYKTIEGAAYSLTNAPNPALDAFLDSVISLIAYGQEPDGYLTTWRTINPAKAPAQWVGKCEKRWDNLGSSHELYNAGHLFEAASAHYHATGKRNFLDIAIKNADLLVATFLNPASPQANDVPGHQIVETGLLKLYQISDNQRYYDLSKHFLELRGDSAHRHIRGDYSQDHKPVTEQDEVVGHAVRAVYMYAAMTDIPEFRPAAHKLWNNMITKKLYITGGLGARHAGEAFGNNYELPNRTAYAETCAAIGGVYWADRMFRLTGDAQYVDILERMLYNGVIAGISLNGTEFFYPNPLEADSQYAFNQGHCTRAEWFDCSCCPTNLIRFIPFIPNLIYAVDNAAEALRTSETLPATSLPALYINLFVSNKANITLNNNDIRIEQQTEYPWNGTVRITVSPEKQDGFALKIRRPGWSAGTFAHTDLYEYKTAVTQPVTVSIDGKNVDYKIDNGYITLNEKWQKGTTVEVRFPMEVREVAANALVADDSGKYAFERGPLVYCMEEADNPKFDIPFKTANNTVSVEWKPDMLNGINIIRFNDIILIPYYTWSNRGVGRMKVWME